MTSIEKIFSQLSQNFVSVKMSFVMFTFWFGPSLQSHNVTVSHDTNHPAAIFPNINSSKFCGVKRVK